MSRPDFGKGVPRGVLLDTTFELNESSDEDCPAGDLAGLYEMWRQLKLLCPDDPGYIGALGFRVLTIFLGAVICSRGGCLWMGTSPPLGVIRPPGTGKPHASSRLQSEARPPLPPPLCLRKEHRWSLRIWRLKPRDSGGHSGSS